MSEARPDPDALLERVKRTEAEAKRGRLKVFFGAAPGVGKTYAMLEAARAQQKGGVDVVIGWVETHKRAETEARVRGHGPLGAVVRDHPEASRRGNRDHLHLPQNA
jgi:two-component system sensor histidine kinase KdpD